MALKHQTATKWFIHDLKGPFGIVNGAGTDHLAMLGHSFIKIHEDNSLVSSNIQPPVNSLEIVQNDFSNCGICCILFIRDFIFTQASLSWRINTKEDDSNFLCKNLGSTLLTSIMLDKLPNLPSSFNMRFFGYNI